MRFRNRRYPADIVRVSEESHAPRQAPHSMTQLGERPFRSPLLMGNGTSLSDGQRRALPTSRRAADPASSLQRLQHFA